MCDQCKVKLQRHTFPLQSKNGKRVTGYIICFLVFLLLLLNHNG